MRIIAGLLILFFAFAQYLALSWAPPDRMMGEVYRILFVHVPAAWMALLLFTANFIFSLIFLLRPHRRWDDLAHSAAEIGLVFNGLALALGSLWGRPTWGVWWTWDPRLTATALLFVMYGGYLILRRLIEDPDRRAKLCATVGLMLFLNVPLVYLSVKWWRSLHQVQSSPETMAPDMVLALRLNALALLGLCVLFLFWRVRLAQQFFERDEREEGE